MNTFNLDEIYSLYLQHSQAICTDTRKIIPQSIFFALKGNNFDGNLFAIDAIEKGCSWAIVDNPNIALKSNKCILVNDTLQTLQALAHHHRKQFKLPVIAITGSNGKTTTKELVTAVLSKKYNVLSTPGNFNNHIGLPLTLLKLHPNHQIAVIEMGANHPGEIRELCKIAHPDYAVISSIGKEHLEGFKDLENIKRTNGELYEYVLKHNGKIFIHVDNFDLISILKELNHDITNIFIHENFILYSDISHLPFDEFSSIREIIIGKYIESQEDIYVHLKWLLYEHTPNQNFKTIKSITQYQKNNTWENIPEIKTHLLAYHNFVNALCAICIGNHFSINTNDINLAISQYIPDKNRMQFEKTKHNFVILDAYNANPTSMMAALTFFKEKKLQQILPQQSHSTIHHFQDEDKVLILGDMFELGEHSQKEHISIIEWIKENFQKSKVYLIGNEFTKALKKTGDSHNITLFHTTQDFLDYLSKNQLSQKFILIKASRGMQLEKTLAYL